VTVVKSLWASVQGDPVFMRRVNGWLTIFWILMIPFSIFFGLLSSVSYVSALSLWALVSGHWSAWQASRVEVEQMAEAKQLEENPIEDRVVEKLIAETEVGPADAESADAAS
jgi:hypothetical protein